MSPSGAAWEQGPCELARADRRRTPSSACLACHDGSSGPAAGVAVQPSPRVGSFPRAPGDSMGHPVSVDYVQATMSRPHQYEPAMTLPVDVPLVNGRIECTTCHTGSSSAPRHVVDEQRLCSACHRM